MNDAEFEIICKELSWKYPAKNDRAAFYRFCRTQDFERVRNELIEFASTYEGKYKPPIGSLIKAIRGATQGATDTTYKPLQEHSPRHRALAAVIRSGQVTQLLVRGREYPAITHGDEVYIVDSGIGYPAERIVTEKTLDTDVLVPAGVILADAPPEHELSRQQVFMTWSFLGECQAAETPPERLATIKRYMNARDRISKPVAGRELENMQKLIAKNDAESASNASQPPDGTQIPAPASDAPGASIAPASAPVDECETVMGPDIMQQAEKWESPL